MGELLSNSAFIDEHRNEIVLDNKTINIIKSEVGLPYDEELLEKTKNSADEPEKD